MRPSPISSLPAPLIGVIVGVMLGVNTIFWSIPVILLSLVKRLMPTETLRKMVAPVVDALAQCWVGGNKLITTVALPVAIEVRGVETLNPQGQYFICSNHQSWNDIPILQQTFYGKAPFFKFFLKQELIWVPIMGLCWWGLDFPFMKRYTPEQLAKNPSLKGKDIAATRIACARFADMPVTIFNFLEGTRFTAAKHRKQNSPYTHLLKPKAGGFAFVLSAMGERLSSMLDVTIVYPQGAQTFGAFITGKVHKVIVDVRPITIPAEFFHGDYEGDAEFRKRVQAWVSEVWQQKDQRIAALLAESGGAARA